MSRLDGNRKLVGWALYVVALLVLAACGVRSRLPYETLTYGFGLYIVGNGVEHATKRPPKVAAVDPGAAP